MKDYQRKYSEEFLPHDVYMQTLWLIRGYDRLMDEKDSILNGTPAHLEGGSGGIGDPTGSKAVRLDKVWTKLKVIDDCLGKLPPEYQSSIFDNVINRTPYPDCAHKNTWSMWRVRFLRCVADEMGWL